MADSAELIRHVQDSEVFGLPRGLEVPVPQPFEAIGVPLHLTKFMVLELVVAVLMIVVFVPLARRMGLGATAARPLWSMFEVMVLFIRDQVARPAIGPRDGDRFLPFLWTIFFFILFLNLIGLVPWGGSPTGAMGVTGALAADYLCDGDGGGHREVRGWCDTGSGRSRTWKFRWPWESSFGP